MFVVWWLVSLNISYELIVLKMVFVVVFMLCSNYLILVLEK